MFSLNTGNSGNSVTKKCKLKKIVVFESTISYATTLPSRNREDL